MSPRKKRRGQNVAKDKTSRPKRRKTKQGRNVVPPVTSAKDSEPSRTVRVGTSDDRWWKSSGLKAGDQIPVSGDPTEFWLLKKAEDDPFWSFHIALTKGKDLYVTYNGDDQNVTLESEISTGKEKFFAMLLQPENKYMLADSTMLNRFLGVKDGKLAMVEAADAMEWKITDDSFAIGSQKLVTYIEIRDSGSPASKWITSGVQIQDRVRVNQSATEEWIVSGSAAEPNTFQVPKQNYYASRTDESKHDVLYDYKKGKVNLRKFTLMHSTRIPRGAVLLHTPDPDKMYVGKKDGKFLHLKENEVDATGWVMDVARIGFGSIGEPDLFPAIQTVNTDVSV